jgi:hypothetical protein
MSTSLEEVVQLLRELREQQQASDAKAEANAAGTAESIRMLGDRLVALEARSRPPSPSASVPAPAPIEPTVRPATQEPPVEQRTPEEQDMPALENFYTDALDEEDEGEYFDATGLPKTPKFGSSRGSSNRRDTLHVRNLKFAESTAQTPAMHVTIKSADYIQYETSSIPNFKNCSKPAVSTDRYEVDQSNRPKAPQVSATIQHSDLHHWPLVMSTGMLLLRTKSAGLVILQFDPGGVC